MTFDEWADSHDLMDHERRLCREYLAFIRAKEAGARLLEILCADHRDEQAQTPSLIPKSGSGESQ